MNISILVKLAICVPEIPCLSGDSLRPAFCTPWGSMEQVISVLSAPGPKTVEHQIQSSLIASLTIVVRKKEAFKEEEVLKDVFSPMDCFNIFFGVFCFYKSPSAFFLPGCAVLPTLPACLMFLNIITTKRELLYLAVLQLKHEGSI